MCIKETACNGCDHVKVCKYREEFLKAQEAVENASISIGGEPVSAIECVESIKLRCKFREHKGDAWNKSSIGDFIPLQKIESPSGPDIFRDSITTAGDVSRGIECQ